MFMNIEKGESVILLPVRTWIRVAYLFYKAFLFLGSIADIFRTKNPPAIEQFGNATREENKTKN